MYSGDPGLGQQCVAGRPLYPFGTRLSSCSSTRACDFSVGSNGYVDSMEHRFQDQNRQLLRHLKRLLLSPAADDDCALATTGSSMLLSTYGGAVALSPLPTFIGASELAGTSLTYLLSTGCLVTVGVSPAAASTGRLATIVCPSWPPLNLLPRVLSTADVESHESQRCQLSCRGGERCWSVIAPTTDHISSCFSTSQAGASDLCT